MKKFLSELLTFVIFVAAIICFYFAATVSFTSALFNLLLFFGAVFFLIQGAGLVDRAKGFGQYAQKNPPVDSPKENDSDTKDEN